ncbi:hypothetical protein [Salipaludibacillus keqinensis]|uniref:hypothetical protein n=1 Tax=Salipaludibacillus keqinensis TaxID=2045207 RepID=UPI0018EE84D4|nr:hypothetical protein [Salipaludibacillus keqinensis]
MLKWMIYATIMILITMIYKKRYRVINKILSVKWMRRLTVSFVMRIPSVREKMMYETFK